MSEVFVGIVKYLVGKLRLNAKMPKSVEIITFKTDDGYHFNLIDIVNYDEKVKKDYTITFEYENVKKVLLVPDNKDLPFEYNDGRLTISGVIDKFAILKVVTK